MCPSGYRSSTCLTPITVDTYRPRRTEVKPVEDFNLADRSRVLLFLGRIQHYKCVGDLIDGFATVLEPAARLLICWMLLGRSPSEGTSAAGRQ